MPRRKKTSKRPRADLEDANEDTNEPMAKRLDQLNLDASVVDHDMQQRTGLSTLQEQPTSQDDESSNRPAEEWQLAGLDPQLALSLPTGAYDPEIPAADNPHYFQVNKVLFAANLERIKRQQSRHIDL